MAIPNEIQIGRYNAILHKLLGISEGAPAPSLAPDIFASIILESDRPEFHFLAGQRLAIGARSEAAGGAGTYSGVALINPSGSNLVVVLTRVWNSVGTSRRVNIRLGSDYSGFTTAGSLRALVDTRFGVAATTKPAGLIGGQASASPAGPNVGGQYTFNNVGMQFDVPIVLAPGTFVHFSDATANEAMYLNFAWRERVMEPSESR